jgi:hypothetical protein
VIRAARAGLLAAFALLVLGCAGRFESFPFRTAEGGQIALRESPPRGREQETLFQPTPARPSSPLYSLGHPLVIPAGNQSFQLSYTSSLAGSVLTIFSDRKTVLTRAALPASRGTRMRFLVPLGKGDRIWGFQLSEAQGAAGVPQPASGVPQPASGVPQLGSLELSGAGTAPFVHGFAIDADGLAMDGSVAVQASSQGVISARISDPTRTQMSQGTWMLELGLDRESPGGTVRFTAPDGERAMFEVSPTFGLARLTFARGSIDFLPLNMRLEGSLRSLTISELRSNAPIPADPGLVLTWDRASWRRPDFEVFSWPRFPSVLIFDTASYDVQDGLFNRIAFFVEKAGHAGSIEPPSALRGIHGYNAHDYKADDLAAFFSTAAQQGIGLTPEEEKLAEILLENGVIRKTDTGYAPGEGSLISISRSSSALLRELLFTHECFHGAFFSLAAYRDAAESAWTSLSPVEKEVWLGFLASRAYDSTDHYLVVNEFQSYLLQQERGAVPGFQALTLSRLRASSAGAARLVDRLLEAQPSSFLEAFDMLDRALQSAGGPPGGRAIAILRSP